MWKKATFTAPKPAHPLYAVVSEEKPAPKPQQTLPQANAETKTAEPASLEAATIENLKNELFELKKINSSAVSAVKAPFQSNVETASQRPTAKPKAFVPMAEADEKPVFVTVQEKILKADGTVGDLYQPN